MNYQLAGADAAAEGDNMVFQMEGAGEGTDVVFEMDGLPADMPILLDNGDGNYVAVGDDTLGTMEPVAVETPAEKEAETITGDMYEGGEEHSTTYVDENGHPVTVEHYDGSEDPQAVYADGTDDPQATYVDGSEDPQTAYVDGSEDPQAGYVDGSEDPQTTYVDGTEDPQATFVDGTEDPNATFVDGTEDPQATYVDETTSAFTDDAAAATQEEFTEPDAAISDETYAQAAGESEVMFETEPEDAFAEAAPESETMFQNDPVAAADNYDETEPAIVEDPYNGEPVAIQYGGEPVATDTFHASEIAEDRFGSEITGDQFGSESTADQFGSETANTVISEGYETASTDYIAYEADKPEMSVEQALEEMMGEESGDGNVELRRVLDEVLTDDVPNGTSSLLKNALQQSGIVSEEHGSLKGALTYQISHVDGKQQVRITGVSDDVKSPSKDIPFAVGLLPLQDALQKLQAMPDHQPRKTRSYDDAANRNKRKNSGGSDGGPEKRILLTEDWKIMEDKEEEESATKNAEEMSND